MRTIKLDIGSVTAYVLILLSSCTPISQPPIIPSDENDSVTVLPPNVNPNGFWSTSLVFRLFSPDSVDLFLPNTNNKYNYNENEDKIWLWYLVEKIYTGTQEDTLIRFYRPNLDNQKAISFGLFRDICYNRFQPYYSCTEGDFNVMGIALIAGYGDRRAEECTMYIEWDTHDFDTIYTKFRKQVKGTPEFPYGYYTYDSVWYNGKLVYTWVQRENDWCEVPIIIKENP